ncbi:phosphoenolpyruvate--protein phosphotransferase [Caproiciproducens sp. NJN-50]|uniref:phosphoenolpyruvate--protein phosphotransferase n=1 Tax=Caproiciproducens sp. NJN-50 TaxID=2507162 RepID=UPI000FFDF9D8|nr:phosphoenolpyruvate--protein phosphotransferase [Caproiciproducens sp. NJN-50]QAT48980.1 phosphoenolpyruvate--protein phosphotransferase [Caproiciproducens sp. NJN-50]
MFVLSGKNACGGIVSGKILFYRNDSIEIRKYQITNTGNEIARYKQASERAISELEELYEQALHETGEAAAQIFQIHQMMLEDDDYRDSVEAIIRTQKVNAEYAVRVTSESFAKLFSSMDDDYMKGRAMDVKDISERLVAALSGIAQRSISSDSPVILAADDLAPSETVQLDKTKILAFVMKNGSVNSHTAILARTMNIPAIVGVGEELQPEYDGMDAIVDGFTGKVYIEPDKETSEAFEKKLSQENEKKKLVEQFKGKDNITLDGRHIDIYANIGSPDDLGKVLLNDAGGIGLFRSEFLFLKNQTYPTEDEQFSAYKAAAESMGGKQVVIRTLDIGADKQVSYFNLPKEENPAMGLRAIRICLTQVDIFKTQLRALYRASAFGKIAIMFPMITSVEEIVKIKRIVDEVKKELNEGNYAYDGDVQLGIMIETPAAAMISDKLAKEVDFFSIGTNDLTQYSLAMDRQNENLGEFFNPHHLAVLRFIKMAIDNAHKNGIRAGICGELGADLDLTEIFLALGVDELSVSPSMILRLRKKIRETDTTQIDDKILIDLDMN